MNKIRRHDGQHLRVLKKKIRRFCFQPTEKVPYGFLFQLQLAQLFFRVMLLSEMKIQQELPAYFKDCCSHVQLHMAMFISCKTAIWMCKWIPGEQQVFLDFPVVFHLLQSPSVSYSFTNCVVEVNFKRDKITCTTSVLLCSSKPSWVQKCGWHCNFCAIVDHLSWMKTKTNKILAVSLSSGMKRISL